MENYIKQIIDDLPKERVKFRVVFAFNHFLAQLKPKLKGGVTKLEVVATECFNDELDEFIAQFLNEHKTIG
jgi:hypothetical protein